jgi:hypothetical protein
MSVYKSIDELDEEDERLKREISVAEKKKILQQYQNKYGIKEGLKKFLDKTVGSQSNSGLDWNAIKFKL